MIDSWFKYDLTNIYGQHAVAVFIDESGDAQFLLKTIEGEYTIHQANSELEELHVKYLIEKAQPSNERFLVYTRSKKDELKFIREYCETCGCLEIRYLQNYIKDKVHQTLNLNINLPKDELIAAAKVSVGKDRTYWMDLSHKGATEIFDLNKELLPYVHDSRVCDSLYRYELSDNMHNQLVEIMLGSDAMFILSGYENDIYKRLEENGYQKTIKQVKAAINSVRNERTEVLWISPNIRRAPLLPLFMENSLTSI